MTDLFDEPSTGAASVPVSSSSLAGAGSSPADASAAGPSRARICQNCGNWKVRRAGFGSCAVRPAWESFAPWFGCERWRAKD